MKELDLVLTFQSLCINELQLLKSCAVLLKVGSSLSHLVVLLSKLAKNES